MHILQAGFRTAVGKAKKGGFRFTRPDDLAVEVINHLERSVEGLIFRNIDDLIVGNAVPEAEQGMQMGRLISLMALGRDVPGMIINRYCGSGVEAINIALREYARNGLLHYRRWYRINVVSTDDGR